MALSFNEEWWLLYDSELVEMQSKVIEELKSELYPCSKLNKILMMIITLEIEGFGKNLVTTDVIDLIIKKVKVDSHAVIDDFRTWGYVSESTEYRHKELIKPILDIIRDKCRSEELSIFDISAWFSPEFNAQCYKNMSLIIREEKFLGLIDVNELCERLEQRTACEVYELSWVLKDVYLKRGGGDNFLNDLDNLKTLQEKVSTILQKRLDINVRMGFKQMKDYLDIAIENMGKINSRNK